MAFNFGDRVMVRPTVGNAYIPDPDHGGAILTAGTEVSWSPYWSAVLAKGNILAIAVGGLPVTPSGPAIYTQAQLDAAVAPLQAQVVALQAQITALQAQIAAGSSSSTTPATPANTNTLHSTFAAFGLLGASTN